MQKHLALSALLAGVLAASTAFAQSPPAQNAPAGQPPASAQTSNQATFQMKPGQWRSSKLIGLKVQNSSNERIGDINELIVDKDGKIEAVVIGVGGFLGMGEHDVALPFNQVKFSEQGTNTTANQSPAPSGNANRSTNPPASTTGSSSTSSDAYRGYPDHAVVNLTKEQLKSMPQVRYER